MSEFIDALKKFINIEYDTQNQQLLEIWRLPINSRVAEGEAITNVEIIRIEDRRIFLRCRENLSKFREGDYLLLNRGDPLSGGISCIMENDRTNELVISPNNSYFVGIDLNGSWCLDRDKVDVRNIILGALDTVGYRPELEDKFRAMFEGRHQPEINSVKLLQAQQFIQNSKFNNSQAEAFARSFATENYYLIQGPPGTGKTWVLAYLATALARTGERVLITAFTHRAINNALRKTAKETGWRKIFKVGQPHYAEDLTWESGSVQNFGKFEGSSYNPETPGLIVGGTCFAVRTSRLQNIEFDTVIFDEASQVTLPLAIAGMLSGRKFIFIGDHKQMAPVIVGAHDSDWVCRSVFETLFINAPGTMLDTTYRMCAEINEFPSRQFYGGKLISSQDARAKRLHLKSKPGQYEAILDPSQPEVFVEIDHINRGMRSPEEAEAAAGIALEAVTCGVNPSEIAIVAPYRAQGRLIRNRIHELSKVYRLPKLEDIVVDTVERIQGQERDLVIISLTTSDPGHAAQRAEFFFQPNRLNVAITRPRVKRIILGSPLLFETALKDPKLQEWVAIFQKLYRQSHIIHI